MWSGSASNLCSLLKRDTALTIQSIRSRNDLDHSAMAKIRYLEIENFRSIKRLCWAPSSGVNCFIGPGDSGKTTILEAIDACLSLRRTIDFTDSDFHNLVVENPIVIRVTLGALPEHLKDLDMLGEVLRGFDSKAQSVEDEPAEGLEVVLTCELRVESDLDPKRSLFSERTRGDTRQRQLAWKDRALLAPSRIGEHATSHLSWSRNSVLGKLCETKLSVGTDLVTAARGARLAFGDRAGAQLGDVLALVTMNANAVGIDVGESAQALIDSGALSFSDGAISLHTEDGVPLRSLGTGSTRLLLASLHRSVASASSTLLIDEVEHGLEPHRIIKLLHSVGSKETLEPDVEPQLQVFMTTHSAVAVRELSGDQLHVVRRDRKGQHAIRTIGSVDPIQGTARTYPEAFLARTVVVCEGASEIGLLRGVDRYYVSKGKPSAYSCATAFVDATGRNPTYILERGRIFANWGYETKVFLDNDVPIPPEELKKTTDVGAQVFHWPEEDALEQALFRYLPDHGVDALVKLAIRLNSEELVDGAIDEVSKGAFDLAHFMSIVDGDSAWEDDERLLLGRAAKLSSADTKKGPGRKGWFKSIAKMEAVGAQVVGPYLSSSDEVLNGIMKKLFRHAHVRA